MSILFIYGIFIQILCLIIDIYLSASNYSSALHYRTLNILDRGYEDCERRCLWVSGMTGGIALMIFISIIVQVIFEFCCH